jgi:hypothetical protein
LFEYRKRRLPGRRGADDPETIAAIIDFDTKALLDLSQMLVELPAQIREPLVVGGLQQQINGNRRRFGQLINRQAARTWNR